MFCAYSPLVVSVPSCVESLMLSALRLSSMNRFADCVQAMSISRNDVLSRGIMRVTVPLFAQMFAVHLPFWVKELVATL